MSNSNKKPYFASLVLMLLSLSVVWSIAIVTPNNASAQEDQQQRGLLGGSKESKVTKQYQDSSRQTSVVPLLLTALL